METSHQICFNDASDMGRSVDDSVDLVVTSPPYPMVEMWDELFQNLDSEITAKLERHAGFEAFESMHRLLDRVWKEVYRVLKPGGLACINIGDATRTINGNFTLYPNHSRISSSLVQLGFSPLPAIIWRKQTNAPNKFMGSGMIPPGAYVTLEHEYILIVRKGSKMEFSSQSEKRNRRESSYFWEERNLWFSDVWMDIKGSAQNINLKGLRERSAAFPFELPYRLINMFSVKNGLVLDPFSGMGTTMLAAIVSGRNSVGYELDAGFSEAIRRQTEGFADIANSRITERLEQHIRFCRERLDAGKPIKYMNDYYGFPVVTRQETSLLINGLSSVENTGRHSYSAVYVEKPQKLSSVDWNTKNQTDENHDSHNRFHKQRAFDL